MTYQKALRLGAQVRKVLVNSTQPLVHILLQVIWAQTWVLSGSIVSQAVPHLKNIKILLQEVLFYLSKQRNNLASMLFQHFKILKRLLSQSIALKMIAIRMQVRPDPLLFFVTLLKLLTLNQKVMKHNTQRTLFTRTK